MPIKSSHILGIRLDQVNWEELMDFFKQFLEQNKPKQIVTLNGEFIIQAQTNNDFRQVINSADLVIPDSNNVLWAGRRSGLKLAETTPGSELTLRLARLAAQKHSSIFLLGGRDDVPKRAGKFLSSYAPGCRIAGYSNGEFDNPELVDEVAASKADIVLVAFGAPKQDIWIARNKQATGAKILVGVGGTLDMLAGVLPRAPYLFRFLCLEWLWRLMIQPSRWRRTWQALVVFPWLVLTRHNSVEQ